MNREAIFNHFSTILNDLIDNSLYWSCYFQRPWPLEENVYGCDYKQMNKDISLCSGATRTCIIDDGYDWVVKFDVNDDAYGSACEREERIYSAAKSYALDRYFAEVVYLGVYTHTIKFYDLYQIEQFCDIYGYEEEEFDNEFAKYENEFGVIHSITISIPLYAYRRAYNYDCGYIKPDEMTLAQKIARPLRSKNIAVAVAFIREYGMDEYRTFSQFGIEQEINDLHLNNIGSINGHLVLIDYSGYHDEDTENSENWYSE